MMERRLESHFAPLVSMFQRARLWRGLAVCWAIAAAAGVALWGASNLAGRGLPHLFWAIPILLGIGLAGAFLFRPKVGRAVELAELISKLEPNDAEVRHLVSAAAGQRPSADAGRLGFLQLRVIEAALAHPRNVLWRDRLQRGLAWAQTGHAVAFLGLLLVTLALYRHTLHGTSTLAAWMGEEISVTPGDTEVERGTALAIAARFRGSPPAEATLVRLSEAGKETRVPMTRGLADPVFGASITEVSEGGWYHVEYRNQKTREYRISVFEFPALARADVEIRYPSYTGQTNRTIRDTLRVSALQGSRLSYTLQLNKPVVRARLVSKEQTLSLSAQSNAVALLPDYELSHTARYSLELLDAQGRANKFPTDFVFQALTNQRPEVRLVLPRGDTRVSKLEEVQLRAEASDDIGLLKYGLGYSIAGQQAQFVELGQAAPAGAKRQFEHLLLLERLGVEVDQAVAYFAWADDYGPDGQARRTFSDMFFAEVRPFEEVFRQDQSDSPEGGSQGGNQGGGGNQRTRLAELQKQIVVATWNLQREKAVSAHSP